MNQLRNNLSDFNDAYISVTGKISALNPILPQNLRAGINYSRKLGFKNSAHFLNCVLKLNNQLIEDAQYLDIVMPIYKLLYYSKNFRKTTGSF